MLCRYQSRSKKYIRLGYSMRTRPLPIRMHLCHNGIVQPPPNMLGYRIPTYTDPDLVNYTSTGYILWLVQTDHPQVGEACAITINRRCRGIHTTIHSIINTVLELARIYPPVSKPGFDPLENDFLFASRYPPTDPTHLPSSTNQHSAQHIHLERTPDVSRSIIYQRTERGREIDTDTRISLSSQSPATISIAWLSCHMLTL
jgi:hypothetical protein